MISLTLMEDTTKAKLDWITTTMIGTGAIGNGYMMLKKERTSIKLKDVATNAQTCTFLNVDK